MSVATITCKRGHVYPAPADARQAPGECPQCGVNLDKIAARLGSLKGYIKNVPSQSLRVALLEDMPALIAELKEWRKLKCEPHEVRDICWCQDTKK